MMLKTLSRRGAVARPRPSRAAATLSIARRAVAALFIARPAAAPVLLAALLSQPLAAPAAEVLTGVPSVHDGDTLTLKGVKIRMQGLDAPELKQSCTRSNGQKWPCGEWSRDQMKALVAGGVTCTGSERDRYGRLLGHCRSDKGDVGAALVALGGAFAYRQYSTEYVDEEKRASLSGKGIWEGEVERPDQYRAEQRNRSNAAAPQASAKGCQIKGNISGGGKKIYHMPDDRSWAATRIDTAKGERWFCNEAEARAAGWQAAKG